MPNRPILGMLAKIISPFRPVAGAILGRLAGQTSAASPTPVADAIQNLPGDAITAIANNESVALTPIKPMRKSVEGWTAVSGAALVLANNVLPALGITVSQPISDAVETITALFGLPAGSGKAMVALGTVGAFAFVWVRRRWYTHTITPAAADRAIAQGKAV